MRLVRLLLVSFLLVCSFIDPSPPSFAADAFEMNCYRVAVSTNLQDPPATLRVQASNAVCEPPARAAHLVPVAGDGMTTVLSEIRLTAAMAHYPGCPLPRKTCV